MSAADDLQRRTDAFADLAIKFVEGLPDVHRIERLANQLQDASTSVGANHRAARRAKSHADFTSKLGTVSGEADETVFWLTRLKNNNIRSSAVDIEEILKEALKSPLGPIKSSFSDHPSSMIYATSTSDTFRAAR